MFLTDPASKSSKLAQPTENEQRLLSDIMFLHTS